jgi:hypothetical protein
MKIDVQKQIKNAFSCEKIPKGKLSVETYDDEGTHEHFSGTSWEEHDIPSLRKYETSMCFFAPEAFQYYLPAFMLAEVNDPETADIIAENIAFLFINGTYKEERIARFTDAQLKAVIAFFEMCANRYNDGVYNIMFNDAADEVRKSLCCS